MKAGFVTILGLPNAGKSTLLNTLLGEKLAIISPKVQTTRHRIKGILTEKDYQLIISDTPGVIESTEYKLHDKMMKQVKGALEDADVALFLVDAKGDTKRAHEMFDAVKIKSPTILVLNKVDKLNPQQIANVTGYFKDKPYVTDIVLISALDKTGIDLLLQKILEHVPTGQAFYDDDAISDLPTKFFVQELIREKLYSLYDEEIPYQSTVLVTEFKEKNTLTKIAANIIVQRESQKGIILGEGGRMIKRLGTEARMDIEKFLDRKIFLELFVKARDKWRDNDLYLKEYGY